jgi:hypothetical protein
MGIGYFVSRRTRRPLARRIMVLAGLSAAAVLGHFLWNSPFLDLFPAYPWTGADFLVFADAWDAPEMTLGVPSFPTAR